MKNYNTMYFIEKFSKIPKDKWIIGIYHNKAKTKFCAMGFCGGGDYPRFEDEIDSLMSLFNKHLGIYVSSVNDGNEDEALLFGDHPKERILNALYLINAIESTGESY